MKRFTVVVALAMVLFASLAMAQTPVAPATKPPEATPEERAITNEMRALNAEFQLFQADQRAVAQVRPAFAKYCQVALDAALKDLQARFKELQTQLDAIKKAAPAKK